jgi:hypothetical protein
MIIQSKKISDEMLTRYFQSSTGFRLEVRNISKGWALDGMFALPDSLRERVMFKKRINQNHPLQNLSMALHNGYIQHAISTELGKVDNWVFCEEPGGIPPIQKYAWLFNNIDNHFLTSAFPCWIPGNIEELTLYALTGYYQYREIPYVADNPDTHVFKLAVIKEPNTGIFHIMITDLDGQELISGAGGEPLVAAYDLYEKIWKLLWSEDAPSITELEGIIDIQKKPDNHYILIEGSYNFEDRYRFYLIGHTKIYSKMDCYRGRYKFLEGEFELFERPLFNKELKVESVDALLQRIEDNLI